MEGNQAGVVPTTGAALISGFIVRYKLAPEDFGKDCLIEVGVVEPRLSMEHVFTPKPHRFQVHDQV